MRYTVPLFQRPYVWNRDENWTALWEDIRRVIERTERAGGSGDTVAPHFLGAVVFDKTPYLSSNLETRQVIDEQQRLTTLQLFLYAARLSAAGMDHERSVRLLSKFLENDEDLFDIGQHPDHRYKVWPTNAEYVLGVWPITMLGVRHSARTQAVSFGSSDALCSHRVSADRLGQGQRGRLRG
ncbi:Protein of unknown function DUF262 [Actinacidiphila yanglinensis]|uniref:GmrSD restriction endonucleases N-terminal domain-containing protein n=1 Tax=Actinacidiphila yanglinensis TaxID=310779 RepID=A0A1H5YKJ6_9ACTN|nr:Protein of unknown function DUF262 [Actinacidiphila yanglinensis]